MIEINSSSTIARAPGEVFEFVGDQANAQKWLGGWLETRPTSETQGVGFTWVDVIEVFGRRVETEFELTEFEPAQKIAFKSIRGSFPLSGAYSFAQAGEGTAVNFDLQGEPGGFFKLAEPLVARMLQRQWDTNVANLKDVMESGG
jgi:uncharacterized protein YndB with AHSA1/START domain